MAKLRLLIVEDDPAHARLIMRGFRNDLEEFDVTTRYSLKDARKSFEEQMPDLVIVDLQLPDGAGTELIDPSEAAEYPVMVITSQGDERTAVETLKMGAIDYIVKSEREFSEMPRLARRAIREWHIRKEKFEAELALRSSEKRYRALIDSSPVCIIVASGSKILLANAMALECLQGKSPQAIIGRRIEEFLLPDVISESSRQKSSRVKISRECCLRRNDGTHFDVKMGSSIVEFYGQDAVQYVFEDITERKEAETEMRIRDRAIASASDGIFIVKLLEGNLRIVDCNEAFQQIVGCSREVIDEYGLQVIRCESRYEARFRAIVGGIFSRQPARDTLRILSADQEHRWVEISISPVDTDDSQGFYIVGVVLDITEMVNAEAEIRRRNAELAHFLRLSVMGELVAGIAHEVNQPLYAISNYAGTCDNILARSDAPQDADLRQCVQRIEQQARRAGEIIRRLRNFVTHNVPDATAVSVQDLLNDSIALITSLLEKQAIEIDIELADDLPVVFVDRIQIEQVFINLISNATDAIDDSNPERVIKVCANLVEENDRQMVCVSVRDYGSGLPPDFDVFEAFQSSKESGMGMGLAISRTLIESHGGEIWVEPASDRGTIFYFTLPTSIQQVAGYDDQPDRFCH